ncbi:MAG: ABC transporter ATP-binding protein [Burkholderiaceae bacterium]
MPEAILELSSVSKRFDSQRALLDSIHLTIHPGERVALLGPSGAGKSTLLNLACGLEPVDAGIVTLAGHRLADLDDTGLSRLRAREVGFVFQAFHLIPYLRLWQNVALALVIQGCGTPQARSQACDMLASVGLEGRYDAYPSELSGGEQQRVALARALVHRPRLILADEPTGNLDPATAARALDLLDTQVRERGAALLMVTHSEQAAAQVDRCIRLDGLGRLA